MLWKDWVQDCIFRDHVGERVRQVMKFKLMECANSYINWGFRHWKKVVHLATIEEHKQFLHQATQRRIKSCIERSLMGSVSDMYRCDMILIFVFYHIILHPFITSLNFTVLS